MNHWTLNPKELAYLMVAIIEHSNVAVATAAGDEKAEQQAIVRRDRHLDLAGLPPWHELTDLVSYLGADDLA